MANNQEVKVLIGKMNKDSSFESIGQYDYIDAHNIRSVGVEGSDANYTTNIEGTEIVTSNLPTGQNRGIGGARFETIGKAYRVVYNSASKHQIREFDYNLKSERVILENITDTGGVDILGLNANDFFSDIRLLHENFLILNNGRTPIYLINLETIKASRGSRVFTEDDVYLNRRPPLFPPVYEYIDAQNRTSNNVRGSLFQFRTQFEYEDLTGSAWSTVSKRNVPINEPADGYGQSVTNFNGLKVTVDVGNYNTKTINIATRVGLGNWLLVKSLTKEYLETLGNNPLVAGVDEEAYDRVANTYSFLFFNDGVYPILDQIDVENPYDAIPHKAETVEVINGNLLAIGAPTEGYDRPKVASFNAQVSMYNPNIATSITGGGDFDSKNYIKRQYANGSSRTNQNGFELFFVGTPKRGDRIVVETKAPDKSITKNTYQYTLTVEDEVGGMPLVFEKLASILPESTFSNTGIRFRTAVDTFDEIKNFYVVRADLGTISSKSIASLKTNSSYQMAIAYFDKFGKYFPIVTDSRFIVKTPAYADGQGLLPSISWEVGEDAPEDAVGYQILLSENQTHQNSIYLTASYDGAASSSGYLEFNLKSLNRFYINEKDSQISYTYTKGDKVSLIMTTAGNSDMPEALDWFRFPFFDLDIVDFTIKQNAETPTEVDYTLKVRNSSGLDVQRLIGKEILLEIYTPKKRAIDDKSLLFYEIGEVYPIEDGKHVVKSGLITEGDWFYKGRLYQSTIPEETNRAVTYLVEDPNFSDNYESKYWSAGRARFYDDETGRVDRKGSIRYSAEYVYGSKYNGLNRFYLERIYGEQGGQTTSKYGAIKKLQMRDNALVCIQEFKVGIIPVYRVVISDAADNTLIADSGKIFGGIQYRTGNYGCGNAKESIAVSRDSVIYFIDDNNCVPVRDSLSGLDVIDVDMTHYFISHIRKAKATSSKLIGYFDDLYREYNVTTEDRRGRVMTLDYEDAIIKDDSPINIAEVLDVQAENGTATYDLNEGIVTYTPNVNYTGIDNISFNYLGKDKNVLMNVAAGDGVPDNFTFNPARNQQPSVLVNSNTIVVNGTDMATPISIVGGEYSINAGAWTSASGMIEPNSSVRVRVMTSSNRETTTQTTLNIGGVTGTFSATTIPTNVDPSDLLTVNYQMLTDTSGGDMNIGLRVELSHSIKTDYTALVQIAYSKYDSTALVLADVLVPSGSTSFNVEDIILGADVQPTEGTLLGTNSPDGSIVEDSSSIFRVVDSIQVGSTF